MVSEGWTCTASSAVGPALSSRPGWCAALGGSGDSPELVDVLHVARVSGEEDIVVALSGTDHLEGEGWDEGEVERPPALGRTIGGWGAAWRVWPKCTVTSPGSVHRGVTGSFAASSGRGRRDVPRWEPGIISSWPVDADAASSWIPTLIIGHFTGCPPMPQSRCQGRSAKPSVAPGTLMTTPSPSSRSCASRRSGPASEAIRVKRGSDPRAATRSDCSFR